MRYENKNLNVAAKTKSRNRQIKCENLIKCNAI